MTDLHGLDGPDSRDRGIALRFLALGFFTRYYCLCWPRQVVFDEVTMRCCRSPLSSWPVQEQRRAPARRAPAPATAHAHAHTQAHTRMHEHMHVCTHASVNAQVHFGKLLGA